MDFLNTITQLTLNILGYVLVDSSRIVFALCLVIYFVCHIKYITW